MRTYRRWIREGEVKVDGRPLAKRPEPQNKLSAEERARVLEVCHAPECARLPPSQIVPRLADRGDYLASESSFYRILREADEQHPRAPRPPAPPPSHCARGPCEVWSGDITWLPGPVRGLFFYLYLILDVYGRKTVGWEVHERESAEYGAQVVRRAMLAEGCIGKPLVSARRQRQPAKG